MKKKFIFWGVLSCIVSFAGCDFNKTVISVVPTPPPTGAALRTGVGQYNAEGVDEHETKTESEVNDI